MIGTSIPRRSHRAVFTGLPPIMRSFVGKSLGSQQPQCQRSHVGLWPLATVLNYSPSRRSALCKQTSISLADV
jgi:hypothetical protein